MMCFMKQRAQRRNVTGGRRLGSLWVETKVTGGGLPGVLAAH